MKLLKMVLFGHYTVIAMSQNTSKAQRNDVMLLAWALKGIAAEQLLLPFPLSLVLYAFVLTDGFAALHRGLCLVGSQLFTLSVRGGGK